MKLKELEINEIGGKYVVIDQGKYGLDLTKIIAFNTTAQKLWNLFKGKNFTEQDVIDTIIEMYDVESEVAEKDARNWLKQCEIADLFEK